jgi:predicted nucleic acid-binding protein
MLRYLMVTNNIVEFERVPAVEVENWVHTAQ